MGKATIDIDGLLSNASLLKMLENIQSKSTINEEWGGVVDKAITFIKSKNKNNKEKDKIDQEKKTIRDLIKKIEVIVDSASNAYYMAPNCNSFKNCLLDEQLKKRVSKVKCVSMSFNFVLRKILNLTKKKVFFG